METPICDFIKKYASSNFSRLHMPGHKGKNVLGVEQLDITEIDGADVLYNAKGIIAQSQDNASELFGTKKTLYSTEGSSLSIRAICYLVRSYAQFLGIRPLVFATRNAHKVFSTASAICDLSVEWLYAGDNLNSCPVDAKGVANAIDSASVKPIAVYLTSPDYLGNVYNIKDISKVCKERGVLLVVDNAHGAYLAFTEKKLHPISLGADLSCDSAHKTLPCLTGCGYLHISKSAPEFFYLNAERAMSSFASTSPSYLLLQSLDLFNAELENGYDKKIQQTAKKLSKLRLELNEFGLESIGSEPLKLTLNPKSFGYEGSELAKILRDNFFECEFSDPDYTVLMFTPENEEHMERLKQVLLGLKKRQPISKIAPPVPMGKLAISPKEALFMPFETVDIDNCLGRVLADSVAGFPPCVPIATLGEVVSNQVIECCKYYGIKQLNVIK